MSDKPLKEITKKLKDNLVYQEKTSSDLDQFFKENVLNASDELIIDMIIEHAKKMDYSVTDVTDREAVKILKSEILRRIKEKE